MGEVNTEVFFSFTLDFTLRIPSALLAFLRFARRVRRSLSLADREFDV